MGNLNRFLTPILFLLAQTLFSQNNIRPTPALVPPYSFIKHSNAIEGYYLTAPFKPGVSIADTTGKYPKPAMILDKDGYLLWYAPVYAQNLLNFKYLSQQNQYSWIKYVNQEDIRYMLLDADFQTIDSFTTINGIRPDLHEFQVTENQEYLLAGVHDSVMNLSSYTFNGVPGSSQTNVIGFVVQVFDVNHQLQFQWNSNDYIHPSQAFDQYGYNPASFDYCHGNAIWEDTDGGFLLSFRNLNSVYKISRIDGHVEWILGGKSSSFSFVNDGGFSAQHDAVRLPNGNISIFDNANMASFPQVSRAVEYSLDTLNWTATKVWEYRHNPGFLSIAMGNHQTTGNLEHLVNYGFNFRPNPSFVLTNDNGGLLTELFFQDSFMSYRSFIFDIPFAHEQRPVISCAQVGANINLSAPLGYSHYEWSTGEQGPSITVQQPGIYQVWVNHGVGMLGSIPFEITDINMACPATGTNAPAAQEAVKIIGYYDLLGREIQSPEKGRIYLLRYDDGHAELKYWGN